MASTYTSNGGIEKIGIGDQANTWGPTTNLNFDIIDRLINGVGTIDLSSSGAAHTLPTTDGTLSDGMFRVLVLSGATEACAITISPNNAQKVYFVVNSSGFDCTFSQGSGSNVSVTNGQKKIIYADGAGSTAAVSEIADDLSILDVTTLGTSQAGKVLTADANGDVIASEEFIAKSYNDTYAAVSSTSNATALNCEVGNVFSSTLSENTTFTFTNPPTTGTAYGFTLQIIQNGSASGFTVTWPAAVDWPSATAPTLTATANGVDQFSFYTHDGGTTWYGFVLGQSLG
tara:strand:- start:895 stop:1755 length:861 start_codon:yes stop_codon:yes gene_type:complete